MGLHDLLMTLDDRLTPAQLELIALSRAGLTQVALACRLGLSIDGVKYRKRQIRAALGGVDWAVVKALHEWSGRDAATQ